jgi:hypothetical protein
MSTTEIDSSLSSINSDHNLIYDNSKWPVAPSATNDISEEEESKSILGCICDGVALLGSVLCQIYTENNEEINIRAAK